MEIKRNGSQPSSKGQAEYFTGNVRVDPLNQMTEPGRVGCAYVTFEPGARTAWHSHPLTYTKFSIKQAELDYIQQLFKII